MEEKLHQNPKSELYIPEEKMDRLEDLADNVATIPPLDSELTTASIPEIATVPDQVGAEYYDTTTQTPSEIPPLDSAATQDVYPEAARIDQTTALATPISPWFWGALALSAISLVVLVGQVLYTAFVPAATVSGFNTSFVSCQNAGGQLSLSINFLNRCEQGGSYVYQDVQGAQTTSDVVEQSEAKIGRIVFSNPKLSTWDHSVTSNAIGVANLPILAYQKTTQDTVMRVVVNNSYITADTTFNNDFNLQKVKNFLENTSEFQGTELLGDESLVLKAFQVVYDALPPEIKILGLGLSIDS